MTPVAPRQPVQTTALPPTDDVLAAFGLVGRPDRLKGGQGNCFKVGPAVLKAGGSESDEIEWIAAVQESIRQDGFRLPRQLRTREGRLLYGTWTCWEYIDGTHSIDRWKDLFEACDSFHRALKGVPRPGFMATRATKWAVADRMVWGEIPLEYDRRLGRLVDRLVSLLRPISLPEQVIHGDFGSGNVLFARDGGLPCVLDFSPYYRPAGFAKAVAAVDAVAWGKADERVFGHLMNEPEAVQLIARAALRRILEEGAAGSADAYEPVVDYLASW